MVTIFTYFTDAKLDDFDEVAQALVECLAAFTGLSVANFILEKLCLLAQTLVGETSGMAVMVSCFICEGSFILRVFYTGDLTEFFNPKQRAPLAAKLLTLSSMETATATAPAPAISHDRVDDVRRVGGEGIGRLKASVSGIRNLKSK